MTDRNLDLLPRALGPLVDGRLGTFPVVVLTGARQTGKSTLAQRIAEEDRLYLTLDDFEIRDEAAAAPDQLIRRAPRMTLDEVQRAPDLLYAVKVAVDRDRTPGRFLLTGSANLLMMKKVSESLAGRAVYLTLWPLTAGELRGEGRTGPWSSIFEEDPARWREMILDAGPREAEPWRELARRGGYPVPAHQLRSPEEREQWFDGYVRTYLERDLQQLTLVEHLADFQRLMRATCLRLGNVSNQAELARDVGLAPSTAQRYLGLMETSYQLVRVPAFAVNRTKRLTKSPKVYWSDTGLALFLSGEAQPRGAHLENLVLTDLLAWREGRPRRPQILYWRTAKGEEVDFVVEWGDRILPVEVKSRTRLRPEDVRHLESFLAEYPDLAPGALVLYDGEETFWMRQRVLALPWWRAI